MVALDWDWKNAPKYGIRFDSEQLSADAQYLPKKSSFVGQKNQESSAQNRCLWDKEDLPPGPTRIAKEFVASKYKSKQIQISRQFWITEKEPNSNFLTTSNH